MRVVLLSFGPKGGAGQYPAKLANGICKHVECHAFIPSSHSETHIYNDLVKIHKYNINNQFVSNIHPILNYLLVMLIVLRDIHQIDPDIIHLPFYVSTPSFLIIPFAKFLQKPIVGTLHDPTAHGGHEVGPCGFDTKAYLRMIFAKLMDQVVVHGKRTYQQALSVGYSKDSLQIIPHGIYDQFGQSDGNTKEEQINTILFFGHLTKYRGVDRLINIANELEMSQQNFRIQVAGSMSDEEQNSEWGQRILTEMRDHPRITVRNEYIPESEVESLFTDASIVLLPYYDATTSGVVMIAYSFATPIVATDTGDMGWTIDKDNTGLLASPNSTEEIVIQLDRLLSDDQLRTRIRSNMVEARDNYSWDKIGEKTVNMYYSVRK